MAPGDAIGGGAALDEAREAFLALAGHELRTPITVLQGYAGTQCTSARAVHFTGVRAMCRAAQVVETACSTFSLAARRAGSTAASTPTTPASTT